MIGGVIRANPHASRRVSHVKENLGPHLIVCFTMPTLACGEGSQNRVKTVVSLDQLILKCVMGQFGVGLEAHLFQDARAVGADSPDAQGQFASDLADRSA